MKTERDSRIPSIPRSKENMTEASRLFNLRSSYLQNLFAGLLVTTWVVLIVLGIVLMNSWSTQPGETGVVPRVWPLSSNIPRSIGKQQLVLFVHPKCPCSIASATELDRLRLDSNSDIQIWVVFVYPKGADSSFASGRIVETFEQMKGVQCLRDLEGREGEIFGAKTSGHVFYFDEAGICKFQGGLTQSRAHEGECDATRSLQLLISRKESPVHSWPVFGCGLQGQ